MTTPTHNPEQEREAIERMKQARLAEKGLARFTRKLRKATRILQRELRRMDRRGGFVRVGKRGKPVGVRPWVTLRVHWGPDTVREIHIGKPPEGQA